MLGGDKGFGSEQLQVRRLVCLQTVFAFSSFCLRYSEQEMRKKGENKMSVHLTFVGVAWNWLVHGEYQERNLYVAIGHAYSMK